MSFTPASRLSSLTVSDATLAWAQVDDYVANGLNQYASINGAAPAYDLNGNMTADAQGRSFAYDAENVLRHVEDASSAAIADYAYYADGARKAKTASGATSAFYYDANQEIAEYDGATLVRRYLRLPGSVDEPFLMIDYTLDAGCTLTSAAACERYVHQNRLGSVVAVTDAKRLR